MAWNSKSGLRQPFNPNKTQAKFSLTLLCPEYGLEKPYLGRERTFQKSTASYLAMFDKFNVRAFHVPNGGERVQRRNKKGEVYSDGANLKKDGVKAGVSDWHILIPFELEGIKYPGMVIELKAIGGTIQDSQINYLNEMYEDGYYCAVCWNLESFEKIVKMAYL